MSSRTVVLCNECWNDKYPGLRPDRLKHAFCEICYLCRRPTFSGIYIKKPKEMQ